MKIALSIIVVAAAIVGLSVLGGKVIKHTPHGCWVLLGLFISNNIVRDVVLSPLYMLIKEVLCR